MIKKKSDNKNMNDLIINEKSVQKETFDLWEQIPNDVKQFLFLTSAESPESSHLHRIGVSLSFNFDYGIKIEGLDLGKQLDRSVIFVSQPIEITDVKSLQEVKDNRLYYCELPPKYKYKYLKWLTDIKQPIEPFFVKLFAEAVELFLFTDRYNEAFDMLLKLKDVKCLPISEYNKFNNNVVNSLLTFCMTQNQEMFCKMIFLYENPIWRETEILIKYFNREPIFAKEIVKILRCGFEVNDRYLYDHADVYADVMKELLKEKTEREYILPQDFISEEKKVKPHFTLGYNNPLLPWELRNPDWITIPDTKHLREYLKELHNLCHERTKLKLRELKKRGRL